MADSYENWLNDVQAALQSIDMPFDDSQNVWRFDFQNEFDAGVKADDCRIMNAENVRSVPRKPSLRSE